MPIKTLMEFGLSEKEAKTYLSLLKLEVATANDIAKESGVNRSSTYVVLESLRKQGFVTLSNNKAVQKYLATSPEMLLNIAKDKAKKQKDIEEKIEEMLPELRALHKDTRHKPKVFIYEGQEAVRLGFYDIFDEQAERGMKTFRVFQDISEILDILPPDFIKNDATFLKKAKAKMKLISPKTDKSIKVKREYKRYGIEDDFVMIPEKSFNNTNKSTLNFSIYEDKVEFFSPKDLFLVIIESQEIADILKNVFELAWGESKKLEKNNMLDKKIQ